MRCFLKMILAGLSTLAMVVPTYANDLECQFMNYNESVFPMSLSFGEYPPKAYYSINGYGKRELHVGKYDFQDGDEYSVQSTREPSNGQTVLTVTNRHGWGYKFAVKPGKGKKKMSMYVLRKSWRFAASGFCVSHPDGWFP